MSQKTLKHTPIYSIFNAELEYDIGSDSKGDFLNKNWLYVRQNCMIPCPETNVCMHVSSEQWFLDLENIQFCSFWKTLSNGKNVNLIAVNTCELLSKYWCIYLSYIYKVDPYSWRCLIQVRDHFKIAYLIQFCELNTNLKSVFVISKEILWLWGSHQWSVSAVAHSMVHANLNP